LNENQSKTHRKESLATVFIQSSDFCKLFNYKAQPKDQETNTQAPNKAAKKLKTKSYRPPPTAQWEADTTTATTLLHSMRASENLTKMQVQVPPRLDGDISGGAAQTPLINTDIRNSATIADLSAAEQEHNTHKEKALRLLFEAMREDFEKQQINNSSGDDIYFQHLVMNALVFDAQNNILIGKNTWAQDSIFNESQEMQFKDEDSMCDADDDDEDEDYGMIVDAYNANYDVNDADGEGRMEDSNAADDGKSKPPIKLFRINWYV